MPRKPCCISPLNISLNRQGIAVCKLCGDRLSPVAGNPFTLTSVPATTAPAPKLPPLKRMNSVHDAQAFNAALGLSTLALGAPHCSSGSGGTASIGTHGHIGALPDAVLPFQPRRNSFLAPLDKATTRQQLEHYKIKYPQEVVYQKVYLEAGEQVIKYFRIDVNGKHWEIYH